VIVLDTTVLVYAVGTDHPLREPCQHLIRAVAGGTAAAAHAAGAEALVSADTGFSGIAAIHHVVPDADGVARLLAAPAD
jgi:hypothetical protein